MKIHYQSIAFLLAFFSLTSLSGQKEDISIKVYDFDEGLSHRNVFKIQQDNTGFLWIATISGLNRFDGYNFLQYNSSSKNYHIPVDVISDIIILDDQEVLLAHPDYLTYLDIWNNETKQVKIKEGTHQRRTSYIPYNLFKDKNNQIWMSIYDETSGKTRIQKISPDGTITILNETKGQYSKRPITQLGNHIYVAAYENELWRLDSTGIILKKFKLPITSSKHRPSRISGFQVQNQKLWVFLADGRLYFQKGDDSFEAHPMNAFLPRAVNFSTFLIEEDKSVWLGGRGILYHFDILKETLVDYNADIREYTKNICQYRQIFKDQSGTIWLASDFGLIKIVQAAKFFTHYLSGGSEYCSDFFCSTRGITEDDEGNIYISYYNSIHQLDPKTGGTKPLFPFGDFFNAPFGLHYHEGALWTGNGLRINPKTLNIDTLLANSGGDGGHVMTDKDGKLWLGNNKGLYTYDTSNNRLQDYTDTEGIWDSLDGQISYLYQGKFKDYIWVGTLDNGLTKLDIRTGVRQAYTKNNHDLQHPKVNGIYESGDNVLWIATGHGLHRLDIRTNKISIYTTDDGLPNNFINGLLPEGDSILWLSTDLGLSRFNFKKQIFSNFFLADGLSANEFNRVSFFKSKSGRMYFGGLNGVNAFEPSSAFLEKKQKKTEVPVLLTTFAKLDSRDDSLTVFYTGLNGVDEIEFTHHDKYFALDFTLADYRNSGQNLYSYKLEGYENEWSPASSNHSIRYNNIPAGIYTFRLKARAGREDWNKNELSIKVIVKDAYYNSTWFRVLMAFLGLALMLGIFRYRIYRIKKREKALEILVQQRTKDLENEKQKSEELLLNILPAELAEELKKNGVAKAKRHEPVTVMFSDFEGFSRIAEKLDPEVLVALIDRCFRAFDEIIGKHGLEKIKTVGDAYLCVGGISGGDNKTEAVNMINAALDIQDFLKELAIECEAKDEPFFRARIGIHTGPVVAGIVGIKKFAYDIWGDTVNVASRMETYGTVNKVNVSETTYLLIKDDFDCKYHGDFTEHDKVVGMYLVTTHLVAI